MYVRGFKDFSFPSLVYFNLFMTLFTFYTHIYFTYTRALKHCENLLRRTLLKFCEPIDNIIYTAPPESSFGSAPISVRILYIYKIHLKSFYSHVLADAEGDIYELAKISATRRTMRATTMMMMMMARAQLLAKKTLPK